MPKTKKPLSDKQIAARHAASERMKAMHASKKQLEGNHEPTKPTETTTPPETQGQAAEPTAAQASSEATVTLSQSQFDALMQRLERVEGDKVAPTRTETFESSVGLDNFGRPQGFSQPYPIDPNYYKSPLDKLYDLSELRRFNLRDNYTLTWDVEALPGDTKYGTSFIVPKFIIVLKRKMYGDDGEPTGEHILIQTGIFFEDPAASIKEAVQLGLPIDNANSREFLEQMRFLRYKQWLLDIFNPQLPKSTKPRVTDKVIDGKVYQIEDRSEIVD